MPIVISHNDADGILSVAALFLKYPEKRFSIYFATPNTLKIILCKAIARSNMNEELFVFDLTPTEETAKLASFFKRITWIDHHIWDNNFGNGFINDPNYSSNARLCSDYFGVKSNIFDLADEIDRNNVKSDEAAYLRDLIDAVRFSGQKNANSKLKAIASKIANGFDNVKTSENNEIVERFRRWLEKVEEKVGKEIKVLEKSGKKIAVFVTSEHVPTRVVYKKVKELGLDVDILAVFYYYLKNMKMQTKIEFRSFKGFDVHGLAKKLGGGGHEYASGVLIRGFFKVEEFLSMF